MGNQFLALSLFIMLLSFFIVLNSLSTFEESKAKPIMNSLTVTFSAVEQEEDRSPDIKEDPMQAMREGSTLDKLDAFFQAHISSTDVSKNRLGTNMHIRVPLAEFQQAMRAVAPAVPDSGYTRIDGPFVQTLISLLQAQQNIPYRMDMVLNLNENPAKAQSNNPVENAGNINLVAGFARTLQDAGLPPHLVTAGLGQGKPSMIDLYFYRYEPFNPLQSESPG